MNTYTLCNVFFITLMTSLILSNELSQYFILWDGVLCRKNIRERISLTSIVIPNGVASLGDWCFCGCTSLKEIVIPNSVKSLEECCFGACHSLVRLSIPDSVTYLGDSCFTACVNLI